MSSKQFYKNVQTLNSDRKSQKVSIYLSIYLTIYYVLWMNNRIYLKKEQIKIHEKNSTFVVQIFCYRY